MKFKLSLLILILLMLCGCGNHEYSYDFFAMNTFISLRITTDSREEADALASQCEALVFEIEQQTSRTVETSDVSIFNASSEGSMLREHSQVILGCALNLSSLTEGAYDITVAPLVELWNVSAATPRVPDEAEIAKALAFVGYENLTLERDKLLKLDAGISIDLGSIAKGYALGRTAELLESAGVKQAVISFGGNVALVGEKEDRSRWKIGIKNPSDPSQAAGYLYIGGGCVSVSGDYERYFEMDGVRYHHIISPEDGAPVSNGIHSVAVLCEDAMLGDALSTAIFVGGIDLCEKLYLMDNLTFEALIHTDEGVHMTSGMTAIYQEAGR